MPGDISGLTSEDHSRKNVDLLVRIRRRLQNPHFIGVPLFLFASLLSMSMVIAPFLLSEGKLELGDDGSVGGHEHDDKFDDVDNGFARLIYRMGDVYCHQKSERSYIINGNQMPVCSRDVGIFFGLVIGSVLGVVYRRRMTLGLCMIFLIPMAMDGGLQAVTPYESINILRLVTGLIAGFGIGRYINSNLLRSYQIMSRRRKSQID